MKVDVVGIGGNNLDQIIKVPRIPRPDEKVLAFKYEAHGGGVNVNTLTQLSRLKVKCGWIGKIGDDYVGRKLIEFLEDDGIDYSQIIIERGASSPFAWIIVDKDGRRTIIVVPNVSMELSKSDVESRRKYLESAKLYHTECLQLPLAPSLYAAEICKKKGVLVSFDLDVPPGYAVDEVKITTDQELMKLIKLTDIFIPCKSAALELSGEDDIKKSARRLLELGPRIVAITLGKDGSITATLDDEGRVYLIKTSAFDVDVVDTTGAGDCFHGGFIYGVLKKWDLKRTSIFANAVAALKCTKIGARSSPTMEEVEVFLQQKTL